MVNTKRLTPMYQIRGYLDAFDRVLARSMVPRRYICVDESMNQWLGCDLLNLKNIPRKSLPIGQEFRTLANEDTSCSLQLDTVSDPVKKGYDGTGRNLIATLKRLTEL
jgi:hypothetical protein